MSTSLPDFRPTLARFATGVTVVATVFEDRFYGLTVNAFCSVSLDPPLVLISLENGSQTLGVLRQSQVFSVNILTNQQQELSKRFARKEVEVHKSFDDIPLHRGITGVPLFDETLAYIECQVVAEYAGGDHTIFLGQVVQLQYRREGESGEQELQPLLYFCSRYCELERPERLNGHVQALRV
jgi:flavin reductase (DIM6/NTAB) family NADH-FMN oxidoreductase RutF